MLTLARTLKSLGDPTRLRILRLLAQEPLSVGEITAILGTAQPSVSRQLAGLKRAGLVSEARQGAYAIYSAAPPAGSLLAGVAAELAGQPDPGGDLSRLAEVLRRREERGGGRARLLEPGRSWPAWARALTWLLPAARVADLGCGDGALTGEIARWASQVVAVDHDPGLLAAARRTVGRSSPARVRFLRGRLERLPLPDACVDVAILSQTLHFLADAGAALREAHRILAPGGRLLLLDLAPHGEEWVREKLGHRHLGFRPEQIASLIAAAGFASPRVEDLPKGPGQPFRVLVATATRPAGGFRPQPPGGRQRRTGSIRSGRRAVGTRRGRRGGGGA